MKQDWLDSIRERMGDYEEPTPEGLWDAIEASVFPERKPRKTVILPWVWRTAAAAAVVAFGVFAGLRLMDRDAGKYYADSRESRTSSTTNPSSSADKEEVPASSLEPVTIVDAAPGSLLARSSVRKRILEPQEGVPQDIGEAVKDAPEVPDEELEDISESDITVPETDHDGEDWSGYASATDDGPSRQVSKPAASLSLTGGASNSQDIRTMESKMFYRGTAPVSQGANGEEATNWFGTRSWTKADGPVTRVASAPVTTDANHRRPVRVSLTFDYPLGRTFALESGLTYSMLYSTFSTISGSTVSEDAQTLRYLGIPLKLNANVFGGERLAVYLTGGGMAEKCVSGKVKSTTTVSGARQGEAISRTLEVKPILWSLNAAAGLQLNVTDKFGFYAEPGLSYHFNNNSEVQSIYTEHPLDFVLTFGARFSFR